MNRKILFSLVALIALVALPQISLAHSERIVLDFNDSAYRTGRDGSATLFLKRELRHQYPGLDFSTMRLKKVLLVAKSKHGRGMARLRVGHHMTDPHRLDGQPATFHNGHPRTFDKVRLPNPAYSSKGPWQINLKGRIKVRKVVLVVENHPPYHRQKSHYGPRWEWGYHR